MARDILDLGADVYDDTVVAAKHRISPKKRNYIIGLSISAVLLAGLVTFTVVASQTFLQDVNNVEKIQFYYTPTSMLAEGEEQTLTLYKLDPNTKYPSTFRIPERVKGYKVAHVGPEAFVGHTEIKKVVFTKYIKSIGDRAFSNCTGIEKFSWNKALTEIGNDAFYNTAFLNNLSKDNKAFYKIPSGVLLYVGSEYFPANSALIPDSLSAFEKQAIKEKYGLSDGNMYTFEGLNITNLTSGLFKNNQHIVYADFPSFLTKVGTELFSGATALKGVDFSHSEVKSIAQNAFKNCSSLSSIKFSEKLESIGEEAFASTAIDSVPELHNISSMGDGIFRNCHSLVQVTYPISEKITTVPNYMFAGCSKLDEIHWGDSSDSKADLVTGFGYGAFEETAFTEFVVPKNVLSILDNTFTNCSSLSKVSFFGPTDEETEENIIPGSDDPDLGIKHMGLDGNEYYGQLVGIADIRSNAFRGDSALTTIDWYDKDGVTHSETGTFKFPRSLQTTNIDSFNMNDNRTFQGSSASKVIIENNVSGIGSFAFADMIDLMTVEFKDYSTLRTIGSNSFENDIKLEAIDVPSSVTNIGASSFHNCEKLASVNIKNTQIRGIRPSTFENCTSLTNIDLPESITAIYEYAFKGATKLEYVIIPKDVSQLNSQAFYNMREPGAEHKFQALLDIPYSSFRLINAAKDWIDLDTAFASFKTEESADNKIAGVSYWNGDKDNPSLILLNDVLVSGTPTKTSYNAGDTFDSTGATITANYSDSTSLELKSSDIKWNPLVSGDTEATGTYTVGEVTKTIVITGITVA